MAFFVVVAADYLAMEVEELAMEKIERETCKEKERERESDI